LGQISDWVQEATADRTPLIQLADRVGRVFVWVILGLAILTAGFWSVSRGWEVSVERTVSLLTIACPCALALAAPLVITVAIGRAAKEKIWIRDGNSLERLAKPGLMCLDKTGTLTFGDLRVIDWSGPKELLMSIARIELESEHPVARALVDYGRSEFGVEEFERRIDSIRVSQVRQEAGRGIYGRVDGRLIFIGRSETPIAPSDTSRQVSVWVDGEAQGKFRLGDSIRPNLVSSLRQIRDRGWKLAILSGDDSPQVQQIADALSAGGVELVACHGGLSPEEKMQRLGELRREGTTTVMVGDGVNDAVALAAADVGIAVRGPCELAMKNAPIFIGERHLEAIPRLLDASRNAVKAIHRCFAASLLYNALTVGLAMTGYIHPLIAAIFMPISGITVLTMAWSARTFPQRLEKNS
jgi:Cu2+-exporting ATPase